MTRFSKIIYSITGSEQCTERFMELPLVEYRAQRIGMKLPENYLSDNTLRVLKEYQFNCSSTIITSLILGINIRTATNNRTLFPSVQVFRPNDSIVNQYHLVTGSERTIYYSTSNVSTSGVYEYPLNPPISVMSGDLLAVSQPPQDRSAVRVYYIDKISFNSSLNISIGSSNINLSNSSTTNQLILVYPVTGKTYTHIVSLNYLSLDEYCVNSINSITASVIREKVFEIQRSQNFYRKSQFLYPQIMFLCSGSIKKWIFGAVRNNGNFRQSELQIWRQLGHNNFTKIGSSSVNADTMPINDNLYEFVLQTPLEFQEGDIFGVYAGHNNDNNKGLVLFEQRESGPINLRISPSLNSPPSTISESLITVNNDFPLVTVEISKSLYSCFFLFFFPRY